MTSHSSHVSSTRRQATARLLGSLSGLGLWSCRANAAAKTTAAAAPMAVAMLEAVAQWQITSGPRGMTVMHARHAIRDIYLSRAEGSSFEVIKTFEAVRSGQQCKL
jgi:hypothetical protein